MKKLMQLGYDQLEGILFSNRELWVKPVLRKYQEEDYAEDVVLAAERLAYILRSDFNIRNGLEDRDED